MGDEYTWIAIVGLLACLVTAFSIGANDAANTFSFAIGSGALPLWGATIIAAVLEMTGALLLGGAVADSIKTKIIDASAFEDSAVFMLGMLCTLIGAGIWLMFASLHGLPVSTTHSVVGALIGFGVGTGNLASIRWHQLSYVFLSWILAPIASAIISGIAFYLLRRHILRRQGSLPLVKRIFWIFLYVMTFTFSYFLVTKNPFILHNTKCEMYDNQKYIYTQPCIISKWSSAHIGLSFLISASLASILTILLSLVVYKLASHRIKRLNLGLVYYGGRRPLSYYGVPTSPKTTHNKFDHTLDIIDNTRNQCIDNSRCKALIDGVRCGALYTPQRSHNMPNRSYTSTSLTQIPKTCDFHCLRHGVPPIPLRPYIKTDERPYIKPDEIVRPRRRSLSMGQLDAYEADLFESENSDPPIINDFLEKNQDDDNKYWSRFKRMIVRLRPELPRQEETPAGPRASGEEFEQDTEAFFSAGQVVSVCLNCLGHSANDTANAVGPFAAILAVTRERAGLPDDGIPASVLLAGGLSMALGLAILGYRVIQTVGFKLVRITPTRGFTIECCAGLTVMVFSMFGIPLSTTHCTVGSTVGVGLSEPKCEDARHRNRNALQDHQNLLPVQDCKNDKKMLTTSPSTIESMSDAIDKNAKVVRNSSRDDGEAEFDFNHAAATLEHIQPSSKTLSSFTSLCETKSITQCLSLSFLNFDAVNSHMLTSIFLSWIGTIFFSAFATCTIFSFAAYSPSI